MLSGVTVALLLLSWCYRGVTLKVQEADSGEGVDKAR